MTSADILILIATYNGADRLNRVLEGYERQTDPGVSWAIVVVDNASTDSTQKILAEYQLRLPLVNFYEPMAGKNRCLNNALRKIKADLVICSDDDAIPNESFLLEWSRVIKDLNEFDIFGAKVVPEFEVTPPKWLDPEALPFDILYAANNRVEGEIIPGHVFGPNMAVRGRVFEGGAMFDETIGPNNSDIGYTMGSETEFCMRMANGGAKCFFLEGPVVRHIVRANQMTRAFVRGRAKRMGRAYARLLHDSRDRPRLDFPGLRFLPHNVRQVLRWVRKCISANPERMRLEWNLYLQSGYYDELRERFSS